MDGILYLIALICFLSAALGVPAKVNLTALGLAAWVATAIV